VEGEGRDRLDGWVLWKGRRLRQRGEYETIWGEKHTEKVNVWRLAGEASHKKVQIRKDSEKGRDLSKGFEKGLGKKRVGGGGPQWKR